MSNIRYVNLSSTQKKWRKEYYGDFEAPLALYPMPSRPSPTPTPSPSVTPSITPSVSTTPAPSKTPSVTPSLTPSTSAPVVSPSVTPTITPTKTVTPSVSATPSITPTTTVTPSISISPTPSITPTITPTPSTSPLPQYYILAENTDELLTEGSDNLMTQDGPNTAEFDLIEKPDLYRMVVTNLDTSTTVLDTIVADEGYTGLTSFASNVNIKFDWTRYPSVDAELQMYVWEVAGTNKRGRLITSSAKAGSGTFTYSGGTTNVFIEAKYRLSTDQTTQLVTSSYIPAFNFPTLGPEYRYVYVPNNRPTEWGIDSGAPEPNTYSSYMYSTGKYLNTDPVYYRRDYLVRTSKEFWTRYIYRYDTRIVTASGGVSNSQVLYNATDTQTLINNL